MTRQATLAVAAIILVSLVATIGYLAARDPGAASADGDDANPVRSHSIPIQLGKLSERRSYVGVVRREYSRAYLLPSSSDAQITSLRTHKPESLAPTRAAQIRPNRQNSVWRICSVALVLVGMLSALLLTSCSQDPKTGAEEPVSITPDDTEDGAMVELADVQHQPAGGKLTETVLSTDTTDG